MQRWVLKANTEWTSTSRGVVLRHGDSVREIEGEQGAPLLEAFLQPSTVEEVARSLSVDVEDAQEFLEWLRSEELIEEHSDRELSFPPLIEALRNPVAL